MIIPKIDVSAASYSSASSFHYTYDSYDYYFYFSGSVASPNNYYFDSTTLDYLINKSAEGINISLSSKIGSKINFLVSNFLESIYLFVHDFLVATNKFADSWFYNTSIYGWEFQFTGEDPNYPNHDIYGTAYGWRFIGYLGETIDLVLDSQGQLYGSNPIGNYSFSVDEDEMSTWSIHQHDGDEDLWYQPYIAPNVSFEDLISPYIQGKSLYFTLYYDNNTTGKFCVDNFVDTYILCNYAGVRTHPQFYFYSPSAIDSSYATILNLDNKPVNSISHTTKGNYSNVLLLDFNNPQIFISSFCLPNNWQGAYGSTWNLTQRVNCKGVFNAQVYGYDTSNPYPAIYLGKISTTPLPNDIIIPTGDPIPVGDIDPDPTDFDPDPDSDPDPVPGIDYPIPDPGPEPVPPVPPIVSGNDDLWPDMNDIFNTEAEMDSFLTPLSNFEFTSLANLTDEFSASIVWVSTIMMSLYNGSEYSVLFSILAIFFIACALLGIYKWWSS